jgi:hypothetical protein
MSDTHVRPDRQTSSQGFSDKLQQSGEEVKQRASDAFDAASEAAREKLDELGKTARDTADRATDTMKEKVGEQQHAGADYAMRFAGNIRRAAKAFERDTPIAAHTIEMAADYVEDAAEKMRNGSPNDIVDGVTSFARRQPAAFLGLSVLAGFVAVRFLKASAGRGTRNEGRSESQRSYQAAGERRSS